MKYIHRLPAFLFATTLATLASAQAQLTINYDYTGAAVPDNGQLSQTKILDGLAGLEGSYTKVVARLNLTSTSANDPMFLGDLYSSLTFGQFGESRRIAVLLNRPGRVGGNVDGSALSSLNVTLDDSATTNVFATTSSTGTYQADGRLGVNPQAATPASFDPGSNGLTALNGAGLPSNRVSLIVGDYSQGGKATLSGWGVSVTGTAASTGTFTPGANASISDGNGSTNTLGANLDTTGSTSTGLVVNLAGNTTVTGVISGGGGIDKRGIGTLIYSAANTYSGPTTISAGVLGINGDQSLAIGNVSVGGEGTRLIGTGTIGGDTTIGIGAIHSAGGAIANVDKVGIQTFDNAAAATTNLSYAAGSIFEWDINGNTNIQNATTPLFDQIVGSGTLTVDGTAENGTIFRVILGSAVDAGNAFWNTPYVTHTWDNIFTGFASVAGSFNNSNLQVVGSSLSGVGSFSISGTSLTWTAVPEPTSALAGLLITAGLLRRRRVA